MMTEGGSKHSEIILSSGGVIASLVLAEPTIFLTGFSRGEQSERAPALLRGSLVLRITKPTKIKSINLAFKGISRTEWPEGIPPEKSETFESKDVFSHDWKFFNASIPGADMSSGAHVVQSLDEPTAAAGSSASGMGPVRSPLVMNMIENDQRIGRARSNTLESSLKRGLGNLRNDSPLRPKLSLTTTTASGLAGNTSNNGHSNNGHNNDGKNYRTFQPAEYTYNFELLLPQRLPETVKCNFGSVHWVFELHIDRHGTFKTNLAATHEIPILRGLGMSNLEASEPIVINRDWEDLLHYEIIIAGKAFPVGGTIPIAFSFVPYAKIRCHRIRLYVTEHTEYYCRDRRVHRVEPSHKFLLLERVPKDGIKGSLLEGSADTSRMTELEFNVTVPRSFQNRHGHLRPNANTEHIKIHHWIKVVMRLSRQNTAQINGKMKCYELSIDSPITLIDNRTVTTSQLPAYQATRTVVDAESELSLRPYNDFVQDAALVERPIHFVRQPSVAPPPFDADIEPPSAPEVAAPPGYDALHASPADYRRRFEEYLRVKDGHPRHSSDSDRSGMSGNSGASAASTLTAGRTSDMDDAVETASPLLHESPVLVQSPQLTENSNQSQSQPQSSRPVFSEIIWREDYEPGNALRGKKQRRKTNPSDSLDPLSPLALESASHADGDDGNDTRAAETNGSSTNSNTDQTSSDTDTNEPLSSPAIVRSPALNSVSPGSPSEVVPLSESSSGPNSPLSRRLSALGPASSASSAVLSSQLSRLRQPSSSGHASSIGRSSSVISRSGKHIRTPGQSRGGGAAPQTETWWDRRDSAGSIAGRYYRQSSIVSVDLADQGNGGDVLTRQPSHISEMAEAPEWYPLSQGNSRESLPISINEYQGRSPLLGSMDSVNDIAALGLDDYDFEDDAASVHSACYNILST